MKHQLKQSKKVNQVNQVCYIQYREERRCNAKTKSGFCKAITGNVLCANGKWRCVAHCGTFLRARAIMQRSK
jgi:hypothetical protein